MIQSIQQKVISYSKKSFLFKLSYVILYNHNLVELKC